MTQYITMAGVGLDDSGSMWSIRHPAKDDYNRVLTDLSNLQSTEGTDEHQVLVSVVTFGERERVSVKHTAQPPALVPHLASFDPNGGSTPLYDAFGELIRLLEQQPVTPDTAFLVSVITDGGENSSRYWSAHSLAVKIKQLEAKGNWTFTARVPRGHSRSITAKLGLAPGNVLEWDTTERGLREATVAQSAATSSYMAARSTGLKSTKGFYARTEDLTSSAVSASLTNISHLVRFFPVSIDSVIRPFVEARVSGSMIKGSAFYELTKTESVVQPYKKIAIRDLATGAVYCGEAARVMLGLPIHNNCSVKPSDHTKFKVFIQSTSVNRALKAGSELMYYQTWDKPIVAAPTATPQPVVAPPTTPQLSTTGVSNNYIQGYKDGFPAGKAKHVKQPADSGSDYLAGYSAGYKDGQAKTSL